MSTTYDAAVTTPKDEVRTFVGDTGINANGKEQPWVFTDEIIDFYLNQFFNNPQGGVDSCRCAVWLMRKHAVELAKTLGFSRSIGEMSLSYGGQAAEYTRGLANELEEICRAKGSAPTTVPFSDGNVPTPPRFWRGMHDEPAYPLSEYDPYAANQYPGRIPYDPYTGP